MTTVHDKLANTFEVWHADNPNFLGNADAVLAAFPQGFTHVAEVECDEVGRVFQLTNHITEDWTTNPEVTPLVGRSGQNTRSTSVGDVIVRALPVGLNEKGEPRWQRWTIEMVGLREF